MSITRLPFPVQTLSRVETYDYISGARLISRYAYHHGYYDRHEREFRGFGMVEQWDTEETDFFGEPGLFPIGTNEDDTYITPPVHTKTWFHNGYFEEAGPVSRQFAREVLPGRRSGLVFTGQPAAGRADGGRMA